jgi:hypothetical protein
MTTSERLRPVFDTNVLVSAILFPRGVPGQALALAHHLWVYGDPWKDFFCHRSTSCHGMSAITRFVAVGARKSQWRP